MKNNRKIRIGFDFDGVVFYNPTRIIRPMIYFVKRYLFGIKKTRFYIPRHPLTQKLAAFLHKTSYGPNKGFEKFLALISDPRYEVYIITARLSFMKDDIQELLRTYDLKKLKRIIQNHADHQPHLYKEALLKKLELDYFVEDNWDIVEHLAKKTGTKVIWMSNLIDNIFIKYRPKAKNLGQAVDIIRNDSKPD